MADGNKSGIEKLRIVAKDCWFKGELVKIGSMLNMIANQIELEQTDAFDELTETICTLTREIYQLREHGGKQDADREAAADWVAAHGGLDAVEVDWSKKQDVGWTLIRVVDALGLEFENDTNEDIFDELNERLMPPGLSWPQWDDGKQVTKDDAPEYANVISFYLDGSGYDLVNGILDHQTGERVERPSIEVFGADGLPIKVGDVVFSDDRTAWIINGLNDGEYLSVEKVLNASKCEMRPEYFTHKTYDAQKRIDDDATLAADVYCKNYGIEVNSNGGFDLASFIVPMIADLLRRQRELDSKMGGE